MVRFVTRIVDAVRFELETRQDLQALRSGADPRGRLDLLILQGQMKHGKRETPLWRVIWEARKIKPPQYSFSHFTLGGKADLEG